MFAPVMRGKLQTNVSGLSPVAKARIKAQLKHGDQARIAEMTGARPDYVKDVFGRRSASTGPMAERIWKAANLLLRERIRLQKQMQEGEA